MSDCCDTPLREMTWREEIEALDIDDGKKERILWKIDNAKCTVAERDKFQTYIKELENELNFVKADRSGYIKANNRYGEILKFVNKYEIKFDPFDNQEDDFTFIYHGKRYYAAALELDRAVADKYRDEYVGNLSKTDNAECESRPSSEWYENRYQQDCITINQLNTTIDTLVDKLALLRKNTGLN